MQSEEQLEGEPEKSLRGIHFYEVGMQLNKLKREIPINMQSGQDLLIDRNYWETVSGERSPPEKIVMKKEIWKFKLLKDLTYSTTYLTFFYNIEFYFRITQNVKEV